MTDSPSGVPPPEEEAAAQAETRAAGLKAESRDKQQQYNTERAERLAKMAAAVARGGELYFLLPRKPAWYRRIGEQAMVRRADDLPAITQHRLEFAYSLALARRRGLDIHPAYPGPTYRSIAEARTALRAAMEQVRAVTLACHTEANRIAA
jgi:hypothetical protein